jgi:hypothetical protein
VHGARKAGYTYDQLINKIIEVAHQRYATEEPDFFNSHKEGLPGQGGHVANSGNAKNTVPSKRGRKGSKRVRSK